MAKAPPPKAKAKQAAPTPPAKRKAAPKKAAPKRPPEIMTLRMALEQLAGRYELSKTQANEMAAELIDLVKQALKAGDRVRMTGIGTIEVRDRPARKGHNPATGAEIQIAASKKVAFRPSVDLKHALSNGGG